MSKSILFNSQNVVTNQNICKPLGKSPRRNRDVTQDIIFNLVCKQLHPRPPLDHKKQNVIWKHIGMPCEISHFFIAKYGFSIDLTRRSKEHARLYGPSIKLTNKCTCRVCR